MGRRVGIIPSLLGADPLRLAEAVAVLDPVVDAFHIDVMDFHFADNAFGSPELVRRLREVTDKPLDCHLMVADPARLAGRFAAAGADTVICHAEALPTSADRRAVAEAVRAAGARPGLGLLLGTDLNDVVQDFPSFAVLLVVTVAAAGFGEQAFSDRSLARVREVRGHCSGLGPRPVIQVDGGVDRANARALVEAGADGLVIGSGLFGAPDLPGEVALIRGCLCSGR